MSPQVFSPNWRKATTTVISALSFVVFLIFDFLDTLLCIFYRYIDDLFEGQASSCYCGSKDNEEDDELSLSETLYGRKNVFRDMGFLGFAQKSRKIIGHKKQTIRRWSDCGCESCLSWMKDCDQKLHVVVKDPSQQGIGESDEDCIGSAAENVIFLHGFLSSSSFWTESVFPNVSDQPANRSYRLFAVDLLGFGRSPKPRDCMYTLKEHLEMIEKSVIRPFELSSFHLVAHSMGCLIAIALAAKHSKLVKSFTLVAPPYIPCKDGESSLRVLEKLASRKVWPPMVLGTSFMSWYEHLGRCVCFIVCRNHRTWERIVKLFTRKRDVDFMIMDLTRHTHHSAWHTMHNVISGGAKLMHGYLQVLRESKLKVVVIHGDRDHVVPMECINNIQIAIPNAEINIIRNADHSSVVLGRHKDFTRHLQHVWASTPAI